MAQARDVTTWEDDVRTSKYKVSLGMEHVQSESGQLSGTLSQDMKEIRCQIW